MGAENQRERPHDAVPGRGIGHPGPPRVDGEVGHLDGLTSARGLEARTLAHGLERIELLGHRVPEGADVEGTSGHEGAAHVDGAGPGPGDRAGRAAQRPVDHVRVVVQREGQFGGTEHHGLGHPLRVLPHLGGPRDPVYWAPASLLKPTATL